MPRVKKPKRGETPGSQLSLDAASATEAATATVEAPHLRLLTTGQAAQVLGIRSVNTIKRWVYDGLLEGHRLGGRVMVSAESVAKLALNSRVPAQKAYEQRIAALDVLEPDEPEDVQAPPLGRKPWEEHGPGAG